MNTEDAKDQAKDLLRDADNCIRANPVPAVLTALGVGFLLGALTRFVEPPPRRERWQEALDDVRDALDDAARRGRRAYAQTSEVVRSTLDQVLDKAREKSGL